MITAAEKTSALADGTSSRKMKTADLITFLIEEAQHHVITDKRAKNSELALAAQAKKAGKKRSAHSKGKEKAKGTDADATCDNCHKLGHKGADCWSKGGGKEGQGPRQKKKRSDKAEKADETAIVANDEDDGLFAFTCSSDFQEVANAISIPKSRMGGCVDSGASQHYSLSRENFSRYRAID